MKNIITISRETGSGGHTIGQMLAEKLGFTFYDGEIVDKLAKELDLQNEDVKTEGEFMDEDTEFELISGIITPRLFSRKQKVPFDKINQLQNELILRIAQGGNCVIVGRNADYILKDFENAFHVFVHANMDYRVSRVLRHEKRDHAQSGEKGTDQIRFGTACVNLEADASKSADENRIRHELELKDKTRAVHYNYFTNRIWGMVSNYNLMIDSSLMTKTQCCELISQVLMNVNGMCSKS